MELMAASDLSEMEFAQDGYTVRLRRGNTASPPPTASPTALPAPLPATAAPAAAPAPAAASTIVGSPLYGTVHLLPAPGQPPFVQPGNRVKAGQTLCTVEAMKMFHEVLAEADGTLQAVLVSGGQEVEAGQPLFRIG